MVEGPWQTIDPAKFHVNPNGTATIGMDNATAFFRLRVVGQGGGASIPVVRLEDVPPILVKNAKQLLERFAGSPEAVADEWTNAEIAPFAIPLGSPMEDGKISHYEFKVISKPKPNAKGEFRKFSSDQNPSTDRGYIVCSTDENDLPILEFSTESESVVETLLKRCGNVPPARILRFGPSFWVAEDAKGELLANQGTEPFKVSPDFLPEMNSVRSGIMDTETGQDERPVTSKVKPAFYQTYREFKSDFRTNSVYDLQRKRRSEHAKAFWDAEKGILPEILKVNPGETAAFLPRVSVDALITDVEQGERAIATVQSLRLGGFQVTGITPGRMGLKVRVGETITRYVIEVASLTAPAPLSAANISEPHWKNITEAYAGGWGDQMRWRQLRNDEWCDLVGCGPTALGMLLGWHEHVKNVPSAFYTRADSFSSISTVDAPQYLNSTSEKGRVIQAYSLLHELCDVICDPFSDAGATMPGDLVEGWAGYLFPVNQSIGVSSILYGKGKSLVGSSTSWAYDWWGDDWDSSGSRVANGIKSGRPGVVGLGVLWHYVVAYGYLRQDYVITIDGKDQYLGLRARYFKCNEGWGKSSPAWYSAYDVFLGLSANVWQKTTPQP
jgi:hypothetical protein